MNIASERFAGGRLDAVVGLGGSTGSPDGHGGDAGLALWPAQTYGLLHSRPTRFGHPLHRHRGPAFVPHRGWRSPAFLALLTSVLDRAAAAALALAKVPVINPEAVRGQSLVAMSMFGPCERCAHLVRLKLEEKGFQVIGFSAAGVCDRAMEDMIAQGYFAGVVDLAPGGVGEHLLGGMRSAGPHRLEAAGKRGNPPGHRSQWGEPDEPAQVALQARLSPAPQIRFGQN